MIISLVAAIGKQRQLSLGGKLPWKVGDDMDHFKNLTMGHHVLMGRKTFQSLARPLPGRKNIILSKNADFSPEGCYVFSSFRKAIKFAENNGETELFVIGGSTIYDFSLRNKFIDKIYLTEIDYNGEADVFFPKFNQKNWQLKKYLDFEENYKNDYSCRISIFNRKKI